MSSDADFTSRLYGYLSVTATLQEVKRNALRPNNQHQTVPGHYFNMQMMAMHFGPRLKTPVDIARVYEMIAIHDLPEAIAGDTPVYLTVNDQVARGQQHEREEAAMQKLKEIAPDGDSATKLISLWGELNENKTPEAKLVHALDKLEAIFQPLQHPNIRYWGDKYDPVYYTIVLDGRRKKYCEHEPVLMDFLLHLMAVTEQKMRAVGMDPAQYR